jgi:hypothetical protein
MVFSIDIIADIFGWCPSRSSFVADINIFKIAIVYGRLFAPFGALSAGSENEDLFIRGYYWRIVIIGRIDNRSQIENLHL